MPKPGSMSGQTTKYWMFWIGLLGLTGAAVGGIFLVQPFFVDTTAKIEQTANFTKNGARAKKDVAALQQEVGGSGRTSHLAAPPQETKKAQAKQKQPLRGDSFLAPSYDAARSAFATEPLEPEGGGGGVGVSTLEEALARVAQREDIDAETRALFEEELYLSFQEAENAAAR